MKIPNLDKIKGIPDFGKFLYEALRAVQQQSTAVEVQTNTNPLAPPEPPPTIQGLKVTGKNGQFHVAIQDQSEGLKRGVKYYVEHADNPNFTDAHTINIGDSRSHTVFLGNETRYWRAYSAYSSSSPSPAVYHGGAGTPEPVTGGGDIGGPAFLPSNGTGTGAAGQGGVGPGPIAVRSARSGFDWRLQRAQGSRGGFAAQGTPAGEGANGSSGGSGGGGGGIVTSGIIAGTHADRLSTYPSVRYPLYSEYYETDRTVFYWVRNASGTLTVAGGVNVTWVSGDHFINTGSGFNAAQWPAGTPIVINGFTQRVSVVNSPTSLTLQSAAGNGVGLSYSVASGRWVYLSEIMSATLAIPATTVPSDLGENDDKFLLNAIDYYHLYRWTGSAWTWGPGDGANGGDMVISAGAKTPAITAVVLTGAWKLMDGTGDDCVNPVSALNPVSYAGENTGLVYLTTVDNSQNLYFKGAAAFTGVANAATVPTISGITQDAATGISVSAASGASVSTGTALAGATQTVVTALTDPGGGGGAVTDPQHHHSLTSADAPIALPADPIRWMGGKPYIRR